MTPEEKRRKNAADLVAYTAVRLSEGITAVNVRTQRLEQVLRNAADQGVPMHEAEAMTRDLDGIDVAGMIRRAYLDDKFEVTGRDTVLYCLAHRRKCTWLPAPGWWIHDKEGRPLDGRDGNPTDPRGCSSLWNENAPITVTWKKPAS